MGGIVASTVVSTCQHCGRPVTSEGRSCRPCFARREKVAAAKSMLEADRQLFEWRAEGLTMERIAARLGVKRQRVGQLIDQATAREVVREREGMERAARIVDNLVK